MKIIIENDFNCYTVNQKNKLLLLVKILNLNFDFITIFIISNNTMLELNKKYLKHNYYTDILTFDLRDNLSDDAEIYISYERALENSKIYNCTIDTEIKRLIIHGILHLSGLDDKNETQKKEMTSKENYFLKTLFHVKTDERKL